MNFLRAFILLFSLCCVSLVSYAAEDKEKEQVHPSFLENMKKSDEKGGAPGLGRIVISLFFVTALAFLAVFYLKKIGYGGDKLFSDSSLIKVLASKKLSVKSTMHLVEVDNAQYLIVEKENAVSIVRHSTAEIPDNIS